MTILRSAPDVGSPLAAFSLRGRPRVFAHRGGAGLRPENTLAAFDHGLALGADGLELDVRPCRDGTVVVVHDATVDRTTNGKGSVASYTAGELAALDACCRFTAAGGDAAIAPQGIPTLATVLARYPGVPIIIELKGDDPALGLAALEVVREAGALNRVCFGGVSRKVLRAVRRSEPWAITSAAREEVRLFLYRSWLRIPPRQTVYRAFQVPERSGLTRVVSPRFIRNATRAGIPVQVWTVDDPADMRRLLSWGVRGLITDRPDLAVSVVREWSVHA